MRLTVIAATGGIGRHLLDQAVAAGHDVTAVVRTPANIPPQPRPVRVVAADLNAPDPAALESAVAGADAVLSGLGPRNPRTEAGIASKGTRAIVAAMAATGARRLIVVSAAPIGTVPSPGNPHPPKHDPGDGFFMRNLGARFAGAMFRAHYADLAIMEDLVRDSGLEWTISRPPQLTDKPGTGRYREAYGRNIKGGWSVPRADVAHHMLAMLNRPETIGRIVGIAT
ncbi:NAD(P)-dependent oxidoreductase [Hamadaea tsunoensis]|uniref:NAD(P)-dependent oxidoreductase n=1 Tax=Hamadaea tsunoensis TaxID=53368 RepID=UPI00040CA459|nr:NAD(P)H-binding protein [Hamadaea tsunoensis]